MRQSTHSIFSSNGSRKYLTSNEREAFKQALNCLGPTEQLFCLTLLYTGCRISEALSLCPSNIHVEEGFIVFRSLKKRGRIVMRCVPAPQDHLAALFDLTLLENNRLFLWGRTHAWKIIKQAMGQAGITGIKATPRGLRHTYGTRGVMKDIPLDRIQKWLGHKDIQTTFIYTNIIGQQERELAERVW
ncbi:MULTISPECIES: tyrosine-type recombinase/integrase [unclassified Lentilitoribacter]|uniref:tyrosine-type recombinase/integrase n=1 Tax=unclassified Lentilitoribacter TaxID=2647570 RepID=UPI0013A69E17|nr:tyrosine-type recombinase/integrase [Lentilitoribacter sp. Alg239-R112]